MKLTFPKLTRATLFLQGFYYALTALWALINLEHFAKVTKHPIGDPFEMHSIATMALVLGITFIVAAAKWKQLDYSKIRVLAAWQWKKSPAKNAATTRFMVWLALGMALAIILPELYYLPTEEFNWFWYDLMEEVVAAGIFAVWLWKERKK